MECNNLVFPIPKSSYSEKSFPGQLMWIPKKDYSYKDILKYCENMKFIKKNFSAGEKKNGNYLPPHKLENNINITEKLIFKKNNNLLVQKIPSITFEFENKFNSSLEDNKINENIEYIPCIFLKPLDNGKTNLNKDKLNKKNNNNIFSNKILIYYHSNCEDIGECYKFCNEISNQLHINILIVEFPGYGIYKTKDGCSSEKLLKDADIIFKFITEVSNIEESNIILMGRCVGCGPVVYLATKHKILSLILISPFKSIKEFVKTLFPKIGLGYILKGLIKERFNNFENISKIKSPILFIHGKKDNLIPYQHSIDLINECKSPAKLICPSHMTHNEFNFKKDIIFHIKNFLNIFTTLNMESLKLQENYETSDNMDFNSNEIDEEIYIPDFEINFSKILFKCPYD